MFVLVTDVTVNKTKPAQHTLQICIRHDATKEPQQTQNQTIWLSMATLHG